MKDARGHGSNGLGTFTPKAKPGYDPIAERNIGKYDSGGRPMSSNAAAAAALMGALRSTQAPVHQAFRSMPDLAAPIRGGQDAVVRLRNGQIGRDLAYRS